MHVVENSGLYFEASVRFRKVSDPEGKKESINKGDRKRKGAIWFGTVTVDEQALDTYYQKTGKKRPPRRKKRKVIDLTGDDRPSATPMRRFTPNFTRPPQRQNPYHQLPRDRLPSGRLPPGPGRIPSAIPNLIPL